MTSKLFKAAKNVTYTENSAVSHKSTLDDMLDFFYHSAAKRGQDIKELFRNALKQDRVNAIVAMFYLRNIRGLGQGERELFRQCLSVLSYNNPSDFLSILPLVPEYGRWDDILDLSIFNPLVREDVVSLVSSQLANDYNSEKPSILAKWMPSGNTSSKKTRKLAYQWVSLLNTNVRQYRKVLSSIRAQLRIVERDMSSREWGKINYSAVPSYASRLYRKAFAKRDYDRYSAYLSKVEKGEAKINANTLYPYDLVKVYHGLSSLDRTIEAQWRALPNYANTEKNALVVCDVSGSMYSGTSAVAPINVSVSLAIYIAERNKGLFHNQFITFTDTPMLVEFSDNDTLKDKVTKAHKRAGYNTNVQAVFDLILSTAVKNSLAESYMPEVIFIVSDMEFDSSEFNSGSGRGNKDTNFDVIKAKYQQSGYTMPKLVFWNVNSRNMQTPVTVNEKGVYLVSGCSPSIFEAAINTKAVTPYDMMLNTLNNPIFDRVRERL